MCIRDSQGTVLEHLLIQHLTAFYDVGEHNHMKLRGADWNDGLDMADERGERDVYKRQLPDSGFRNHCLCNVPLYIQRT